MWNRIIGIVGPTGSGKSYVAGKITESYDRAAVYQIKRIHEEPAFLGAATDIFSNDIRTFCRRLGAESFRYIYLPSEPTTEERNRLVMPDFELFIRCCYEREDMLMVIDEAHFLCDPHYIPVFFRSSVVMGRSRKLDVLYITQRMSMVHHDITANTHEFLFWQITEPADLDAIERRCGEEVRKKVSTLRRAVDNRRNGGTFTPGEMFRWTTDNGGIPNAERKGETSGTSGSDSTGADV